MESTVGLGWAGPAGCWGVEVGGSSIGVDLGGASGETEGGRGDMVDTTGSNM